LIEHENASDAGHEVNFRMKPDLC